MTEGPLATAGIWSTYPQSFVSIPEAFGDQVSRLSDILPQRYNIFPRNPQNIAYSANINLVSIKCKERDESNENERDLTRFYDENPYTNRKFNDQLTTQKRHQKLRLHNDCVPT